MSSSETGCGDGEELGLEAAAEAGGLTNFSKGRERRKEQRESTQISQDILILCLASLERAKQTLIGHFAHTHTF